MIVGDIIILKGLFEFINGHEKVAVCFRELGLLYETLGPLLIVIIVPGTCVFFLPNWIPKLNQLFSNLPILVFQLLNPKNCVCVTTNETLVIFQA